MNLPTSFGQKIAAVFYDKVITLWSQTTSKNSEGQAMVDAEATETTFQGNVRFDKLDEVRQQYGIDHEIDIVITAPPSTEVETGQIIGYLDETYRVVKAIPYDSHKLFLAQKWSLKSSTLPSA